MVQVCTQLFQPLTNWLTSWVTWPKQITHWLIEWLTHSQLTHPLTHPPTQPLKFKNLDFQTQQRPHLTVLSFICKSDRLRRVLFSWEACSLQNLPFRPLAGESVMSVSPTMMWCWHALSAEPWSDREQWNKTCQSLKNKRLVKIEGAILFLFKLSQVHRKATQQTDQHPIHNANIHKSQSSDKQERTRSNGHATNWNIVSQCWINIKHWEHRSFLNSIHPHIPKMWTLQKKN